MNESLFSSIESRLLAIGLALTAVMFVAFGIAGHLYPDEVLPYAAMTGLNLFIGRGAGMSFGYAHGYTHVQVVPFNMLVETIQVLMVYPLFVLSSRQMIKLRILKPFFMRIQYAAQSQGGLVRPFGIAGLFVFVFVPFWMTGPVVGAIIGFLIGLRPGVNLVIVLGSTYLAISIWALLLNELSDWAATVNEFAPWALFVAIVLIAVAMRVLHRRHDRLGSDVGVNEQASNSGAIGTDSI
jgi:uncharacterized membrane protein